MAKPPTSQMSVRIETTKLEQLKEIAWRRRTTVSAMIQNAVDELLTEPKDLRDVI